MSAKESGTMVVEYKEGGHKRWTAYWTTEQFTRNGENFLRLTMNGAGLTYPFSKSMTWESFDFTPETLIVDGVVLALRTLPFITGEDVEANFLTNEPELYKVEFKQRGIETLETPEGEIDCYKVELVPKLGLLGIFKIFFPKTYFWFTVAPPHRWVKYQGYENGRNSPEVVMDVVKFQELPQ